LYSSILILRLNTCFYEEAADGLERPFIGFLSGVWPMKNGTDTIEIYAYTRPAPFAELSPKCFE